MRSMSTAAAVFAIVLACGCSGSKPAATNSSNNAANQAAAASAATPAQSKSTIADACKLLTQSEASAVMGVKMNSGQSFHLQTGPRCRFLSKAQDELAIDVIDGGLFDGYAQLADKQVSGMGDKAAWSHDQFGSHLFILKGGNMAAVSLPTSIATVTPAVETAGKQIASRM
jgi:hypothetical protein